jgi:hypothetical protein
MVQRNFIGGVGIGTGHVSRGEASREGRQGWFYCDVGVGFIINSNLSLVLKKSSGLTNPDAKPQLRPSMDPFFNRK